ncbi:MAG: type II toxin-antitoxin system RelE/ParE family toxin [Gammaproteobacteria bacterium]
MTYSIHFVPSALKEWEKLGSTIQQEFKNILESRINNPCIPKQKLSGYKDLYKIKLRAKGYRLVYQVLKDKIVILVLAVGKRDKNDAYQKTSHRH